MKHSAPTIESIQKMADVSRETFDRLLIYYELLLKWQPKINLISPSTIENAWQRHFLDSAQIFSLLKNKDARIFDLGSGAGFPGLVLSLLGMSHMHLVESDQRKSVFLQEVIRQTGATAQIHPCRIEALKAEPAEIITSRALAPLERLLELSTPHLREGGKMLFPKGKMHQEELTVAARTWRFDHEIVPSQTEGGAVILQLTNITRR